MQKIKYQSGTLFQIALPFRLNPRHACPLHEILHEPRTAYRNFILPAAVLRGGGKMLSESFCLTNTKMYLTNTVQYFLNILFHKYKNVFNYKF